MRFISDNYYQSEPTKVKGFCCKEQEPKCPVGTPHSSSKTPKWGCDDCPSSHYCHMDSHATRVSICCPKQCQSDQG